MSTSYFNSLTDASVAYPPSDCFGLFRRRKAQGIGEVGLFLIEYTTVPTNIHLALSLEEGSGG